VQEQDPAWTGESANDRLTIAVVKGKKCPQATIMKRSWRELVGWLSRHQERQEKDGPGWLPVIFRNRAARRANKNVAAVTLLVLDMDDGTPTTAIPSSGTGAAATPPSSTAHTRTARGCTAAARIRSTTCRPGSARRMAARPIRGRRTHRRWAAARRTEVTSRDRTPAGCCSSCGRPG